MDKEHVPRVIRMLILAEVHQREPAKPDITVPPRPFHSIQVPALLVLQIPTRLLLEMELLHHFV